MTPLKTGEALYARPLGECPIDKPLAAWLANELEIPAGTALYKVEQLEPKTWRAGQIYYGTWRIGVVLAGVRTELITHRDPLGVTLGTGDFIGPRFVAGQRVRIEALRREDLDAENNETGTVAVADFDGRVLVALDAIEDQSDETNRPRRIIEIRKRHLRVAPPQKREKPCETDEY